MLSALPTRDSFLPIFAVLAAAGDQPLSARIAQEPPVFTAADRLQDVDEVAMRAFVSEMASDATKRQDVLAQFDATETGLDLTGGVRITINDDRTVHIRPRETRPNFASTSKRRQNKTPTAFCRSI